MLGGLNCSAAADCAWADRSSIFASPKTMYVSLAGLLNTSGFAMTNRICDVRECAESAEVVSDQAEGATPAKPKVDCTDLHRL